VDAAWRASSGAVPPLAASGALALAAYAALWKTPQGKAILLDGPPGLRTFGLASLALAPILRFGGRATASLLIVVAAAETAAVTGFYYRDLRQPGFFLERMRENADIAAFLAAQPFPVRAEADRELVPFNWGDWYGIDMFEGYCGVTKNVFRYNGELRFRELFGIGYYIGAKPSRDGQTLLFHGASGLNVYRNPGDHKRVWSAHQAIRVADFTPVFHSQDFDRRRTVYMEEAPPALETCAQPDQVRLLSRETNSLVISADLGCRGMVVAGETYDPGWAATVDGRPARIYEAYGAVRAVVVEGGRHRIEMRYRPTPVLIGAAMTLTGLLGSLLLWIRSGRYRGV
jgi:hypothetical protein